MCCEVSGPSKLGYDISCFYLKLGSMTIPTDPLQFSLVCYLKLGYRKKTYSKVDQLQHVATHKMLYPTGVLSVDTDKKQ